MAKKIMGILGSPNKSGKVDTMLTELLSSAEKSGNEVKKINLFDLNIKACKACMHCRKTGKCSITDDDLNSLAAEIVKADAIVLAAPTYWANVPGTVKNLFDRMAGYVMVFGGNIIPKPKCSKEQKYVLITACTTPYPFNKIKQTKGSLNAMNEFFKSAGMSHVNSVVLPGTNGMKEVPANILGKVRELGKNL